MAAGIPRGRRGRTARRALAAAGVALAVSLVVAACSSTGTAGSGGGTSVPTGAPATLPPGAPADQVASLPGLTGYDAPQYAGYASVGAQPCATVGCDQPGEAGLFYWFAGQRGAAPSQAPTIVWTNGGPGASSFWGFFLENGPFTVSAQGQVAPRPMGWTDTANYLMFDQPLGVGLSFASDAQLPTGLQDGIDQWYRALVHFLERHPDVAANPIVLAGESYGGTYVPLLARAILDGNARAGREVVRLAGTVLAAGWVDPVVQQSMDTTYALTHGLITEADKAVLDATFEQCRAAVAAATPSSRAANDTCSKIKDGISQISGRYLLNLASTGDPSTDPVVAYLNRPDVREAIHARPAGEFDFFSEAIGERYVVGEQDSYLPVVQDVLDRGVPVMVISGLNDATDVNFLGTGAWLARLAGERAAAFHAAPTTQWHDGDPAEVLGYLQAGGGLTWVKALGAGHLAVMDQPKLIDLIDSAMLRP